MSRIINLNSPAKVRNHHQRTVAEVLRHFAAKSEIDDDSKDMAALLVYALREIHASVEVTVVAWEKRDYWMKADRFMRQWEWSKEMAVNLEDVIRNDAWDLLPELLGQLVSYMTDIQVKKLTRPPETWQGAYQRLISESPSELPW